MDEDEIKRILTDVHGGDQLSGTGGHLGRNMINSILKESYYWHGMSNVISWVNITFNI